MAAANSQNLPEIFVPEDAKWASRAAARGDIRRLARGLYTRNLDEPAEQLVRRRWYDVGALYFPGAVITHRTQRTGRESSGSATGRRRCAEADQRRSTQPSLRGRRPDQCLH